jgi:hypothetical protein
MDCHPPEAKEKRRLASDATQNYFVPSVAVSVFASAFTSAFALDFASDFFEIFVPLSSHEAILSEHSFAARAAQQPCASFFVEAVLVFAFSLLPLANTNVDATTSEHASTRIFFMKFSVTEY